MEMLRLRKLESNYKLALRINKNCKWYAILYFWKKSVKYDWNGVKKCKYFGGGVIYFKPYGLFYKVDGDSAIVLYYIFNISIKNNAIYIPKNKINDVLLCLRRLNIDYYFNGYFHNFDKNNYQICYEYAYKKYDLSKYIGDLWKIN